MITFTGIYGPRGVDVPDPIQTVCTIRVFKQSGGRAILRIDPPPPRQQWWWRGGGGSILRIAPPPDSRFPLKFLQKIQTLELYRIDGFLKH